MYVYTYINIKFVLDIFSKNPEKANKNEVKHSKKMWILWWPRGGGGRLEKRGYMYTEADLLCCTEKTNAAF